MKLQKNQRLGKSKDTKIKTSKNNKEKGLDKLPLNYFRLKRELEKENEKNKLIQDLNPKKDSEKNTNKKPKQNLNELVYDKYSQQLREYYDKNQEDLTLIGSSKYEGLPMEKIIKEMGTYKERVLNKKKIDENLQKDKEKNNKSHIYNIVTNYANCQDKLTLTPLAETEKEENEMNELEKKNFEENQKKCKYMRRFEYTTMVNLKADFEKNEENKKFLDELEKSALIIQKHWRNYIQRKIIKRKKNESIGSIKIQYFAEKNKELEELMKKYNELEKKYKEMIDEFYNKENEYNLTIDEINKLNDELKKKNGKYIDELKKLKKVNEKLIKEKNEKDDKLQNSENDNILLKNKILNIDEEFKVFKKKKTLTDTENENKLKSVQKNFDKEKNDMKKNLDELNNEIKEKIKEIEEQKNIMKKYEENNEIIKKEKKKK